MLDTAALLAAYDAQLRGEAEVATAEGVERHGPLVWGWFGSGRGFVTYRDLGGARGADLRALVEATAERYQQDPAVHSVEWKTRGHDHAAGLHDLRVEHGFVPAEPESVMIGREYSVLSLCTRVCPRRSAERARSAVRAR